MDRPPDARHPNWLDTSSRLIADPDVRRGVADYAVRQVFAGNGIDAALHHVLPASVAAHAESSLHRAATRIAGGVLAGGPARRLWRTANRQAQPELLAVIDHPRPGHETVTLQLGPLLHDLLGALAGSTVARAIPGAAGRRRATLSGIGYCLVIATSQLRDAGEAVLIGGGVVAVVSWALRLVRR